MRLGEPGTSLAEAVEPLFLLVETAPAAGEYEEAPWQGSSGEVTVGCNDKVPTARITVDLADLARVSPTPPGDALKDWLVRDAALNAVNPRDYFCSGRRIQVRTLRENPTDDWLLFEGYVERVELAFSGSSRKKPRALTFYCTSALIAADREPNQFLFGQWRRTRAATIAKIEGSPPQPTNPLCRISVPLILNPLGKPNCDPDPITWPDGSKLYVPTDHDDLAAIPWTVAKALRYVQWAAYQPALPAITGSTPVYNAEDTCLPDGVHALGAHPSQWTTCHLYHDNLDEILETVTYGSATILSTSADEQGLVGLGIRALLSPVRDLALEGMSVLEAFAHLSERTGTLLSCYHTYAGFGDSRTYVRFSIRGHNVQSGAESTPDPAVVEGSYHAQ
jgi:hypothetical protein